MTTELTKAARATPKADPLNPGWCVGCNPDNCSGCGIGLNEAQATPEPVGWTDADADAARLAMELECLLLDTKDTAAVSRWWKSANEALDLHRARLAAAQAKHSPTKDQPTAEKGNHD